MIHLNIAYGWLQRDNNLKSSSRRHRSSTWIGGKQSYQQAFLCEPWPPLARTPTSPAAWPTVDRWLPSEGSPDGKILKMKLWKWRYSIRFQALAALASNFIRAVKETSHSVTVGSIFLLLLSSLSCARICPKVKGPCEPTQFKCLKPIWGNHVHVHVDDKTERVRPNRLIPRIMAPTSPMEIKFHISNKATQFSKPF